MAIRYSGRAIVRVEWSDVESVWICRVSKMSPDGGRNRHVETVRVRQSASGPDTRIAVDSPEGYDGAARAALAFVTADHNDARDVRLDDDDCAYRGESGFWIGRSVDERWFARPARRAK